MVHLELDHVRKAIITALQNTSQATEGVYLKLGQTYPALVRELDSDLVDNQDLVSARNTLTRTTADALSDLESWDVRLVRGHQERHAFLEALDHLMERLGELKAGVEDIREDSVQMELLSLNAMVIAVRAGESGRAFSCITDELKKTSNQTLELTEQVGRGEVVLGRSFEDFKASLQGLNQLEKDMLSSFLTQARRVFQGLGEASQVLVDRLSQIQRQTSDVKDPLVRIVVEIQNQDRIRQSIDHVLISLEEMRSEATPTPEAQLDNFAYLEVLAGLCSQVLDEIQDQIRHNRQSFSRLLAAAQLKVGTLERERTALVSGLDTGTSSGALERGFQEGTTLFHAFEAESDRLVRHREISFQKSLLLRRAAKTLVEGLQSFDKILDQFRNVDLAARIQVARHAALGSMKGNASEMTTLTHTIEADTGRCIAITGGFYQGVEDLFRAYTVNATARATEDHGFREGLQQTVTQLKDARDTLKQTVQESQVFTSTFLDQFSQTEADLQTLDRLVVDIEEQKASLKSLGEQVSQAKGVLLAERGLSDWKLNEERLKTMVENFTIFSHKKLAAQLGEFELSASVDSGEVTLF